MQFNSLSFMIFFPIVTALYFVIPKKLRSIWLLIASYYFYMNWNPKYALLMGFSTVVTYAVAILVEKKEDEKTKKALLLAGLLINLSILVLFKYANFVIETVDFISTKLQLGSVDYRLNLLLPVGISFYTFQALGYVIDVYRGEVKAEKNFITYALFVSFFPQLVAGPIERSKNLLGQLREIEQIKLWNAKRVASGAILMVWGLFMKMVIADRVAILVDTVFDEFWAYGGVALVMAAIGFTIQIYCDFGSYSLIAIGAAKVMGFTLMENFNTPYFARNIRDFWARWHISLSTWFKDYLYIPLGGNRKGRSRKNINLMIVFLVSGLWHGANWSYVVWGGIHGAYQVIGNELKDFRSKVRSKLGVNEKAFSFAFGQMVVTFILVAFAWIFFRADNIMDALRFIKGIITRFDPWSLFNGGIYTYGLDRVEMNILAVSMIILFLVDLIRYKYKQTLDKYLMSQNLWFEWLAIIVLILMIFVFGEYGPTYDAKQFIYFQF